MIKKLTDRDHIRSRPGMYLGSVTKTKSMEYILEDKEIQYKEIEYVPGIIKIINEIIDNSVDVAIKSDFKHANLIEVKIDDKKVTVKDNGSGIPVKQVQWKFASLQNGEKIPFHDDDAVKYVQKGKDIIEMPKLKNLGPGSITTESHYLPELCWYHARAGSNFDDDNNRNQIGMNGVGSYVTACFSKKFTGKTDDGKNAYEIIIKDGASSFTEKISKSSKQGTEVTFYPELSKFGLETINEEHKLIIKQRLLNLSISFPEITFKFNSRKLPSSSFKNYIKLFNSTSEIYETPELKFAFLPNSTDDFKQFSYVNGLKIPDGGIHIDTITNSVVQVIREKLVKKYKSIKPGDIRNKLMLVVFINNFKNMKFNSQAKEKLTNSAKEFNTFTGPVDYSKIASKILRTPEIIDNITEVYKIKEEFQRRKELQGLNKVKKRIKSDKYTKAVGANNILVIGEGKSAVDGLSPGLGRKGIAYYELKGKPLNVYDVSQSKFTSNKELTELYQIIKNEGFKKIAIASDADLDGIAINGLLLAFFNKYLPEFLENKQIFRLETPVIAALDKKTDIPVNWVYDLNEKVKTTSKTYSHYFKGLGGYTPEQLKHIIKIDGLDRMLKLIIKDEDAEKSLSDWYSKSKVDVRKEKIMDNDFSIIKI